MEVKLKAGDSLNIPEGCKAVIKDNVVVFEKEEKEEVQEFKDGDVLTSRFDNKLVFIFKEDELKQKDGKNSYYVCHTSDYVIDVATKGPFFFCGYKKDVRLATDEEKQLLFDKMKEQGLRWNAEKKEVEKMRWRAKGKEIYYYVGSNMEVYTFSPSTSEDEEDDFKSYNYFRIKEQAKEAARRMKESLIQYHEELGE